MNTKISLLALAIITIILAGCANETKKENTQKNPVAHEATNKKENLNISILLDLSDRIDPIKNANPSMEFYTRDLGYIESISKGFKNT